jgi:hypothetical protein
MSNLNPALQHFEKIMTPRYHCHYYTLIMSFNGSMPQHVLSTILIPNARKQSNKMGFPCQDNWKKEAAGYLREKFDLAEAKRL